MISSKRLHWQVNVLTDVASKLIWLAHRRVEEMVVVAVALEKVEEMLPTGGADQHQVLVAMTVVVVVVVVVGSIVAVMNGVDHHRVVQMKALGNEGQVVAASQTGAVVVGSTVVTTVVVVVALIVAVMNGVDHHRAVHQSKALGSEGQVLAASQTVGHHEAVGLTVETTVVVVAVASIEMIGDHQGGRHRQAVRMKVRGNGDPLRQLEAPA
jgi:hypothetical protein